MPNLSTLDRLSLLGGGQQKMVAFLKKRCFKPKVIAQRLNLSLSTVYEYQSRAKGTRKALWKKPPGYKPVRSRNKGYQAGGFVSGGQ